MGLHLLRGMDAVDGPHPASHLVLHPVSTRPTPSSSTWGCVELGPYGLSCVDLAVECGLHMRVCSTWRLDLRVDASPLPLSPASGRNPCLDTWRCRA